MSILSGDQGFQRGQYKGKTFQEIAFDGRTEPRERSAAGFVTWWITWQMKTTRVWSSNDLAPKLLHTKNPGEGIRDTDLSLAWCAEKRRLGQDQKDVPKFDLLSCPRSRAIVPALSLLGPLRSDPGSFSVCCDRI